MNKHICPICGGKEEPIECFNDRCEQGVIWEYSGDEAWRMGECPYCEEGDIWVCPTCRPKREKTNHVPR